MSDESSVNRADDLLSYGVDMALRYLAENSRDVLRWELPPNLSDWQIANIDGSAFNIVWSCLLPWLRRYNCTNLSMVAL
jgi:hypothetical protein